MVDQKTQQNKHEYSIARLAFFWLALGVCIYVLTGSAIGGLVGGLAGSTIPTIIARVSGLPDARISASKIMARRKREAEGHMEIAAGANEFASDPSRQQAR